MDLKVLRNFVEIVDCGSLTAASRKLFIAQPALSNQLKALETELNCVLLERNSRHQKLTDEGHLFYERAKSILLLEKAMVSEIADIREGDVGSLKIASIHSGELSLLNEVLPRFAQKYPKVSYEFYETESHVILDMLKNGQVDVGLVRTPCVLTPEMETHLIADDRLVCAYDPEHFSLPGDRDEISVSELGQLPVVIVRRYEEMFRTLCEKERFVPNIRCINQQLSINLRWAEEGLGIAVLPEDMLALSSKTLAVRSFAGPPLSTNRMLVTMKHAFHSKAVRNFLELCTQYL